MSDLLGFIVISPVDIVQFFFNEIIVFFVRVIQKNLLFVVGLSQRLADGEVWSHILLTFCLNFDVMHKLDI